MTTYEDKNLSQFMGWLKKQKGSSMFLKSLNYWLEKYEIAVLLEKE